MPVTTEKFWKAHKREAEHLREEYEIWGDSPESPACQSQKRRVGETLERRRQMKFQVFDGLLELEPKKRVTGELLEAKIIEIVNTMFADSNTIAEKLETAKNASEYFRHAKNILNSVRHGNRSLREIANE